MPWTLGRIAFFLAISKTKAKHALQAIVESLLWGTLSGLFRLTILPITMAFLYQPSAAIGEYYTLFFICSSTVLYFIIRYEKLSDFGPFRLPEQLMRLCVPAELADAVASSFSAFDKRNVLWYFCWGWVAFLVPLLKLSSVAIGETMGQLMNRLITDLFNADTWQDTIAEFVLSDVVISDLLYLCIEG